MKLLGWILLLSVIAGIAYTVYYFFFPTTKTTTTALAFLTQPPISIYAAEGSTVALTPTIVGEDDQVLYRWLMALAGDTTIATNGTSTSVQLQYTVVAETLSYSFTMTTELSGASFYFEAIDSNQFISTKITVVKIGTTPVIISQPSSLSIVAGNPASFTVEATATPQTGVTYQWFSAPAGSSSFTLIHSDFGRSTSLAVSGNNGVSLAMNGTQYYVIVTCAGTVTSNTVTLAVTSS